jgi:glycosyltransferase involved in cell wall biosynthesis
VCLDRKTQAPDPISDPIASETRLMPKISFCTTCMNRLHHLRQTLPENIKTARGKDAEIVLLDYNSQDGMREWCRENISDAVEEGLIKYIRTEKPTHFIHTHAKNIAYKNASGDIIVNLDADNYIVDGYIEFINKALESDVIVASYPTDRNGIAGSFGKIAIKKEIFLQIGGYDENIKSGWAWEDNHLLNRLLWMFNPTVVMTDPKLCLTIDHSNEERVLNCTGKDMQSNMRETVEMLARVRINKKYVANEGREWGKADDLTTCLFS